MKLPRFTLGIVAGVSLSATFAAGAFCCLYFPVADGFYQSPVIPFYLPEDDPKYPVYQRLEDPEYWRSLSESAQSEAQEYCRRKNISADITVRCLGSPQAYEIYYSTGEHTSLRDLLNRGEIESVIVDHIDSKYRTSLAPIIEGEQDGGGQPATRPESK
jgi:hypothetical protein